MNDEQAFLQHILENPSDWTARLAWADWLEERGDPRNELLRLQHTLTQFVEIPDRSRLEERQRELLSNGVISTPKRSLFRFTRHGEVKRSGIKPIGPFLAVPIADGVEMTFACIPPGAFLMGSPESEKGHREDETQHQATVARGFFMGIHPVTQGQWQAIMDSNPSWFSRTGFSAQRVSEINDKELLLFPVENVTWDDAEAFCFKLASSTGKAIQLRLKSNGSIAAVAGRPVHSISGIV